MDYVEIKELIVFAHHGVFKQEKELGQKFVVSARLYLDTEADVIKDDVDSSVHYGEAAMEITRFLQAESYNLIETAAGRLAEHLLLTYSLLRKVQIRLAKPWAPVGLPLNEVAIELSRSWQPAVVALGSNMGDRRGHIETALRALDRNKSIRLLTSSELIESSPYGVTDQEDFLNGAVYIETVLSPHSLLKYMQEVENDSGRVRTRHWGPRTLDLDLIYYSDLIIHSEDLTLPHPEMQKRDFVLGPVCEIAPNYVDPRYGVPVCELLARLEK
ncbi:MAG TPA: 2-amino-4-hydroxy-6-hydroxymethyldihydropteridine diphosphokinase [Oscillospiraceae bacterium]|nr:2-amino-4-hydroxy-6-hydroxymethyldihydropteridine diphosphokinase [Oscillospiraceae bacterium]